MTQRDRDRLIALKKAKKGVITQRQAAEEIGQTERHVRRLLKLLKARGDKAVVHALRGRRFGLYGVTAYNAGRRTTEIGVRVALGASRMQAAGLIVRSALVLVAAGLAAGLPLTLLAGRFLGSQLYGLSPYNSVVIVTAVLTLGLSALIAALIPARRASSISPSQALRSE